MTAPNVINSYTAQVSGSLTPHVSSVVMPGGTTKPMIIVMFNAANNAPFSGATWNGENFTKMGTGTRGWYDSAAWLIPSTTGTFDVIVTVPFFSNNGVMSVWVLGGAAAVSKDADLQHSSYYDTTPMTISLTTTANDSLVVLYEANANDTFSGTAPTPTQGAGQTQVTNPLTGVSWLRQVTSYKSVATSGTATTMSISTASPNQQAELELFEILSVAPVSPFTPSVIII